jgi:hypothetical protein
MIDPLHLGSNKTIDLRVEKKALLDKKEVLNQRSN